MRISNLIGKLLAAGFIALTLTACGGSTQMAEGGIGGSG